MAMNDIGRPLCQKGIIGYVRYRTACREGIGACFLLVLLFLYVVMEAFKNELDSEFQLLFVSSCYPEGINPSTKPIRNKSLTWNSSFLRYNIFPFQLPNSCSHFVLVWIDATKKEDFNHIPNLLIEILTVTISNFNRWSLGMQVVFAQ